MLKVKEHIAQVDSRLQQLLRQYELLKAAQLEKDEKLKALQQQLLIYKDKMEHAEQENLILKASVSKMNPEDKKLFDQKIQLYIKNIDTCISLLSQ